MPLQLITAPTAEPINLIEAKNHLRVTDTADDSLISMWIAAARQFAEGATQRQIIAARWKMVLDSFPGPSLMSVPYGKEFSLPGYAILLPNPPLIQVVSIQYLDTAGTLQTVPATDYTVEATTEPARITPVFGKIWPIPLSQIGSVIVIFDAGYAVALTADATADTITILGWKALVVNDVVRFSNSGGALPAPLNKMTDYFIQLVVSPGVYKVSATAGGAAINLTDTGTGTSFLGEIPEGLRAWLLIRLGSLYENREEVAMLSRGSLQPLAFIDRLLDDYRVYQF